MMGWNGAGMGSLGWLGMGVFWLVLLGLIAWLVVRMLPGSDEPARSAGQSALDILDRRLSSGEIDMEVWKTQRAAIQGAHGESR